MKVINADRMESLLLEVREEILSWWEPAEFDLVKNKVGQVCVLQKAEDGKIHIYGQEEPGRKEDLTPLLTEGQIINMIERILDEPIDISITGLEGYVFTTMWIDGVGECAHVHETEETDLLEALWNDLQLITSRMVIERNNDRGK